MTKRVNATCILTAMNSHPFSRDLLASDQDATLETCESIILCLSNRRFVIVRDDTPRDLWPVNGGWSKVRQLQAGDEVVYRGERAMVRAVDVYR